MDPEFFLTFSCALGPANVLCQVLLRNAPIVLRPYSYSCDPTRGWSNFVNALPTSSGSRHSFRLSLIALVSTAERGMLILLHNSAVGSSDASAKPYLDDAAFGSRSSPNWDCKVAGACRKPVLYRVSSSLFGLDFAVQHIRVFSHFICGCCGRSFIQWLHYRAPVSGCRLQSRPPFLLGPGKKGEPPWR